MTFGDLIADERQSPEEVLIDASEQDNHVRRLNAIIAGMNDREGDILRSRRLMDDPLTLEELSERYRVSKERIRQIEFKALDKIKRALEAA
jgi:RNA polymerase sigma-32 factor